MLLDKIEQRPSRALNYYINELAKIGRNLATGKDPPPGNTIIWRVLSRLTDIHLGFH
ncbi:hypothetical protein OAE37_00740 [Pirellulaceae bacterium]|nr:hypothetical protein [Pirellulaceae bacterium]